MSKGLLILGFGESFEVASLQFVQVQPDREIKAIEAGSDQTEEIDGAILTGYDPKNWDVFVAIGLTGMNFTRLGIFSIAKSLGFKCESFIHPSAARDPSASIGQNCYIGENAVIAPRAKIEYNSCIGARTTVGYNSHVGASVWIGSGCTIGSASHVGAHCIIGDGAMVSDRVKVGKLCNLQIARQYSENVPDKTYHHPLFDEPVRIYE